MSINNPYGEVHPIVEKLVEESNPSQDVMAAILAGLNQLGEDHGFPLSNHQVLHHYDGVIKMAEQIREDLLQLKE